MRVSAHLGDDRCRKPYKASHRPPDPSIGVALPAIATAYRLASLRIPMKSAMHSEAKSATYSDLKPATVPI
jgi:hypothetical protein